MTPYAASLMVGGFCASIVALHLTADSMLRRTIKRRTIARWSGYKITERTVHTAPAWTSRASEIEMIPPAKWWKCALPWPGKAKWAETVQAKAALLGATFNYCAVSAWDWDEAWVIDLGNDEVIASSNKTACALAFLKHHGVDA